MNAKTFDEAEAAARLLKSRRTSRPSRNNLLGLGAQNFQSITEPQFMSFANVTLIYGPNSAGKSVFLDLLEGLRSNVETAGLPNFARLQRSGNRNQGARMAERYVGNPNSMQFWIAVQSMSSHAPTTDADDQPDFELRRFFLGRAFAVQYESRMDEHGDYWLESAKIWTNARAKNPLVEISRFCPEDEDDWSAGLDYEIRVWSLHPAFRRLSKSWTDGRFSKGGSDIYAGLVDNFEKAADGWLELEAVSLDHNVLGGRGADLWCRFRGDMQGGYTRTDGEEAILRFLLAVFRFALALASDAARHVASPAVRPIPTGADATSILVRGRPTVPVVEERRATGMEGGDFAPWDWLAEDACFESYDDKAEGLLDYVNRIAAKESMLGLGYRVLADVHPFGQDAGAPFVTSITAKKAPKTTTLKKSVGSRSDQRPPSEGSGFLVRTLVQDDSSVRVGVDEVGTGVSQVIPVLVALYPGFLTTAVQQPELHLHPRLQSAMGDVLLDRLHHCPDGLTIVESHSEHLLLRILRRLRDTSRNKGSKVLLPLTRDKLIVFYADKREDGGTELHELRVSNDGEFLDRWPHGFFTDRDEDLDAFL